MTSPRIKMWSWTAISSQLYTLYGCRLDNGHYYHRRNGFILDLGDASQWGLAKAEHVISFQFLCIFLPIQRRCKCKTFGSEVRSLTEKPTIWDNKQEEWDGISGQNIGGRRFTVLPSIACKGISAKLGVGALRRNIKDPFKLPSVADNELCWVEYKELICKCAQNSWKSLTVVIKKDNWGSQASKIVITERDCSIVNTKEMWRIKSS